MTDLQFFAFVVNPVLVVALGAIVLMVVKGRKR